MYGIHAVRWKESQIIVLNDEAFFANQEAKALQADLWMWGSVNVKNTFFREQIINMAKKKLPNVTVKIPEKTALDIALGAAQEHFA